MARAWLQRVIILFGYPFLLLSSACIDLDKHPIVNADHLVVRAQTDNLSSKNAPPATCVVADEPNDIWIEKGHKHDVDVITSQSPQVVTSFIDDTRVASLDDHGNTVVLEGRGLGVTSLHIQSMTKNHTDVRNIVVRGISRRITVVGWIDDDDIDLDEIGPHANRPLRKMLASPTQCLALVMTWLNTPPYIKPFQVGTKDDADYAKAFLVKRSANQRPPQALPDDFEHAGNYKLLNVFQTAANRDGFDVSSINHGAVIGRTPDACGLLPSERYPIFTLPGEEHETNNKQFVVEDAIVQMNEARINVLAQTIERNLTDQRKPVGAITPWIWSGIRIQHNGEYSVCSQVFPSFSIYVDGKLVEERKQTKLAEFMKLDENSQKQAVSCR